MTSVEALHAIKTVLERGPFRGEGTTKDAFDALDEIGAYVRLGLEDERPELEHLAASYLSDHDLIYDDVPGEGEPWPDPVDAKNHADLVELLRSAIDASKEAP